MLCLPIVLAHQTDSPGHISENLWVALSSGHLPNFSNYVPGITGFYKDI